MAAVIHGDILVKERHRDLHAVDGREGEGRLSCVGALAIGVPVHRLPGVGRHAIDPTAVLAAPDADAKTERVIDDRAARRSAQLVALCAVLGVGEIAAQITRIGMEARIRRDEANRSAFGACAEQGALRPAQHLDALEVEDLGEGVRVPIAGVAHLDRRIVDVDAGGGGTDIGEHAANRDVAAVVALDSAGMGELNVRGQSRDVIHIADAEIVHLLLGVRRHGDRHPLDVLGAPLRGDGDFCELGIL